MSKESGENLSCTTNMESSLRDRIAAVLASVEVVLDGDTLNETSAWLLAEAVRELITVHIPPIVASAIRGYAQSGLAALSHHGDDSAIEELKRMNKEALQIAQYATTHKDWNGERKRYE